MSQGAETMNEMNSKIRSFTTRKSDLDNKLLILQNTTQSFITKLQQYIQTAGVNPDTTDDNDPLYKSLRDDWTKISTIITEYQTLTKELSQEVKYYSAATDYNKLSNDISKKKNEIIQANKILATKTNDLDISTSRQQSVETSKTSHSFLQGFSGYIGFIHPLKPTSVPLLLGLAFFILFCGGLILKDFFTTSADVASQYFSLTEILEYLKSGNSRIILLGIILTFVLYAIGLYVYFYGIK